MNIDDIFRKSRFDKNKLLNYGFTFDNNNYIYSKKILNDSFELIVYINNNKVKIKVIDLSIDEEYLSYKIENQNGEFVTGVRNEIKNVLMNIKDNCSTSTTFIYGQTNRIVSFIYRELKDKPLFLFDDDTTGVFKNKRNNKWYGIIMAIDKSKLDNKSKGLVEVLNIKLDGMVSELLKNDGYYEAYHMNKKSWISIVLDDKIDDTIIESLIIESYNIVNKK